MILTVKVIPNSSVEKLEKLENGSYKVHLHEPADKGKANAALLQMLCKELGYSVKSMKILTPTSRTKKIVVKDVNA